MKERIVCAAIWYVEMGTVVKIDTALPKNCKTGVVFCGLRHCNCLHTMCSITGKKDFDMGKSIQGFLTTENRFVDRLEAGKIAFDAGQISAPTSRLYSEDLY